MPDSDPITRLNTALSGRYRIERQLGEGGMATVYLADDLRHDRKVALKVLKPELAAVVGAERFLAEIKTTANLQHPHILPLHDSGQADALLFYVMPYVEGESLRERLDREHQLPVDEAVRIATHVAQALDYAHRHGVIHRDIKPANILLHDGQPVVSDFGIALAVTTGGAGRLTETGLSLGTPHYMSPEQATGDASVGAATDIYALGCVLYEMLIGEPPYTGSTPQAVLGKIIQAEPVSATRSRRTVPANVDAAVRRALEKVPADRFGDAADFARALGDAGFRHGGGSVGAGGRVADGWTATTTAVAAVAAILALALGWSLTRPETPPIVTRQVLDTDGWALSVAQEISGYAALAPDGSSMIVPLDGRLGLKQRNSADITPIPGTEGARNPTYSPDAQWIAYAVANEIYKRPLSGGAPVRVADGAEVGGLRVALSWLDDGTILYERQSPAPYVLAQVDEDGGDPLLEIGGLGGLAWVYGLPGSNGALAVRLNNELHVADLRTGTSRLILEGVRRAWYAPTGHLVYVQSDGTVMAVPFDLETLEPTGIGRPLFDGVRTTGAATDIHLASDGTLLFEEGGASAGMAAFQLSLLYLDGSVEALPVPRVTTFSWSPDGASVAFSSQGQIFTYDVDRNTLPRQVTLEGVNNWPFYSPDGTRLVFSSTRDGSEGADLFVKDLTNDSPERSLLRAPAGQFPTQWATETLIFFNERGAGFDVWTLDLSNPEQPEPRPYVDSGAIETGGGLWPGGAFVFYALVNADGGIDGYLRSFPGAGAPSLVARDATGGPFGVSPDGRTLYYTTVTGEVVAARVVLEPVPAVLSVDTLFAVPPGILTGSEVVSPLHPDGDRFLTAVVGSPGTGGSAPGRMILVTNWFEELKERMAEP